MPYESRTPGTLTTTNTNCTYLMLSGILVQNEPWTILASIPFFSESRNSRMHSCHHNLRRISVSNGGIPSRVPSLCSPWDMATLIADRVRVHPARGSSRQRAQAKYMKKACRVTSLLVLRKSARAKACSTPKQYRSRSTLLSNPKLDLTSLGAVLQKLKSGQYRSKRANSERLT